METKADIRKRFLKARDLLPEEVRQDKSQKIQARIQTQAIFRQAVCILTYISFQSEVMTKPLVKQCLELGKQVYCPRVCGGDMEFYRISSLEELKPGKFGILEPESGKERCFLCKPEETSLVLMPGAAFDRKGGRIGYGKGYYDIWLSKKPPLLKIGLAYQEQVTDKIPWEAHDILLDMLVTDEELISIR